MLNRLTIHRKKTTTSIPEQSIFRRSLLSAQSAVVQTLHQPVLGHNFSQFSVCPQAKLTISQPDDPYEQEADRVADQVLHMEVPESPGQMAIRSQQQSVQRRCAACEAEEQETTAGVDQVLRSAGQPLDDATRSFMEPRFGHDFSQVRIHTGTQADTSTQTLNARAYTVGQNIVFGAGQYVPDTNMGKHLLAHELTHVVQQASLGGTIAPSLNQNAVVQRQAVTEEDRDIDSEGGTSQPAEPQSQGQSETAEPVVEVEGDPTHTAQTAGADSGTSEMDAFAIEPLPDFLEKAKPLKRLLMLKAYASRDGQTPASAKVNSERKGRRPLQAQVAKDVHRSNVFM